MSPKWQFGTDGPLIKIDLGEAPEDIFARIDAGLADGPWTLVCAGGFIELPARTMVYSPDDDEEFPEIHLRDPTFPGPRTIKDAFIRFERRPIASASLRITKATEVTEERLRVGNRDIRTLEYGYQHERTEWRQRLYALAVAEQETVVVAAQAPLRFAELMFEIADSVAASFEVHPSAPAGAD